MGEIVRVGDLLVTPSAGQIPLDDSQLKLLTVLRHAPQKSRRPTFGVQFTAARLSSSRLSSRRHAARAYWPHSSSLSRFENVHPQLAAAGFFGADFVGAIVRRPDGSAVPAGPAPPARRPSRKTAPVRNRSASA